MARKQNDWFFAGLWATPLLAASFSSRLRGFAFRAAQLLGLGEFRLRKFSILRSGSPQSVQESQQRTAFLSRQKIEGVGRFILPINSNGPARTESMRSGQFPASIPKFCGVRNW